MKKLEFKHAASFIAFSLLSTAAAADKWEPGVGASVSYAPMYEIEGESRVCLKAIYTGSVSSTPVPVTRRSVQS